MASGGSNPPSHLQLSNNFLNSSTSESLQTPKLSLTPVTVGNTGDNGSKSFTSLEELLNITGINAPDFRPSSANDNGVDSLHKMALAVESSQQGSYDQQPLPKKPRLESPSTQSLSNIRVQPLTFTNSTTTQPDITIASLLHKKQFNASNHNSTVATSPVQSVASTTKTNNTGGTAIQTEPFNWSMPPKSSTVSLQMPTTSALNVQTAPNSQPAVSTVIPSLMQQAPLTPNANLNPKSFLLQLVQLYKHYQTIGDYDGMARIKKQLNVLVGARQGLIGASSNPLLGALSLLTNPTGVTTTTGISYSPLSNTPNTLLTTAGLLPQRTLNNAPNSGPKTTTQASLPGSGLLSVSSQLTQVGMPSLSATATQQQETLTPSRPISQQVPPSILHNSQLQRTPTINKISGQSTNSSSSAGVSTQATVVTVPRSAGASPMSVSSTANTMQQQEQAITVQQKAVKQLQTIMATLPAASRPKTVQEIRDFVQKYSSLISQIQTANVTDLPVPTGTQSKGSAQLNKFSVPLTGSANTTVKSTAGGPVIVPLNFGPSLTSSLSTSLISTSSNVTAPQTVLSTAAMAQVDQHFQNSLSSTSIKTTSVLNNVANKSVVVDLTQDTDVTLSSAPDMMTQTNTLSQSLPPTIHAPMTTQFKGGLQSTPKSALNLTANNRSSLQSTPAPVSSTLSASLSGGIQAGVATPLPPGLTLETLAVLCRLPESELEKLKLPAGLLSAIKVWKDRQPVKKGASPASKMTLNSNRGNIPVLYPPSSTSSSGEHSSSVTKSSLMPSSRLKNSTMKVGDAVSFSSSLTGTQLSSDGSSQFKKPFVIPSSVGFPPRSLHAYIPGIGQSRSTLASSKQFTSTNTPLRTTVNTGRLGSQHMTRFRTKADMERAEKERIQALTKALQTSEEARIAFRFSAHLEKMHSQLLAPETSTPFQTKQDVLARLLPYHVYAESEPPSAAVEKADAVFESVAQVLLSRSNGLRSRFQQILAKSNSEGGGETTLMQMELNKCFLEGEQERIKQEKLEKEQAEQVAADLSMMVKADGGDTFDSEFSLSDAFFPFLDVDIGIT